MLSGKTGDLYVACFVCQFLYKVSPSVCLDI